MTTAFRRVRAVPVPNLGLTAEEWQHPCGAVHWHLACADEHRAFACAFRTPPSDSTGLPHILEHTTLCGSQRYPVRDPFFQMLRRSLQTFMNAMTYPDFTAYPFATQVPKDYENLLGVYLDAVFAPRLRDLDFAQEGHRLAPIATGGWERAGVVYNEMKGAMDGTSAQIEQAAAHALLPDTCYSHNSGGDPSAIPALTHAELLAFHQRCYCPANALFLTYGNQPATDLHQRLDGYFAQPGATLPAPALQPPLSQPIELVVPVPWAEGQDEADVTAAGVTWVWGDAADLDEVLTAELLDRLLLGHAAAPLRQTMESCGIGRSTGASGYGASYRNGQFTAELDGLTIADQPKVAGIVTACLEQIVATGINESEIHAALHQVELARREIHGDHYPYGLELCFRLLSPWNHGVDPLAFLDQAPAIARLRERALQPGFVASELRRRCLDNPHRLSFCAAPDRTWHARAKADEQAATSAAVTALDPAGLAAARSRATDLAAHQATTDDPAVLPDLALSDVPRTRRWAEGRDFGSGLTVYTPGTNGLLHHLCAFPLPNLSDADLDLLPLIANLIGNLGVGERTYDEQATLLNATCGGLGSWCDAAADPTDLGRIQGWLFTEIKGLAERSDAFLDLLPEALRGTRFDELDRLRELVEQSLQAAQDRVTRAGNQLAARAAARGFGGGAALSHRLAGLGRLTWLKATAAAIGEDDAAARALGERLAALLARTTSSAPRLALIGDAAERADVLAAVRSGWATTVPMTQPALIAPQAQPFAATAYTTATAVNYVALAFSTVPLVDPDAPALAVAGRLVTNQVLHPKLREQGGAYGGGAAWTSTTGVFACTSYRDPRFAATLEDMRGGLRWLAACPDDDRALKEAILGVVAGLDSPGSPAGECRSRFQGDCRGTSPARLDAYRAGLLTVTPADIRRVAARWLPADGGSVAAVTSSTNLAASSLGWAEERI